MMDTMQAYWGVAESRFIDQVCMTIDRDIIRPLPELIANGLQKMCSDPDTLQSMFEVDTQQELLRDRLESQKIRLQTCDQTHAGCWSRHRPSYVATQNNRASCFGYGTNTAHSLYERASVGGRFIRRSLSSTAWSRWGRRAGFHPVKKQIRRYEMI